MGSRWSDVFDVAQNHTEDHIWSFTDLNVFITCLGAQKHDLAKQMLESVKEYSRCVSVMRLVYINFCEKISKFFFLYLTI